MNDEIERALTETGRRWREQVGTKDRPDPAAFGGDRGPQRHARLLVLAAAAAVVAIVAGVVGVNHAWDRGSPPTAPATEVVHNGDTVAASGKVVISADGDARLCSPLMDGLVYVPPPDPTCAQGVAVASIDPSALADRQTDGRITVGRAYIEGIWRDGAITVTRQAAPQDNSGLTAPEQASPCPAPAAGWAPTAAARPPLLNFVAEHPDTYSGAWITYPRADDGTLDDTVKILTVGVVGDVADAKRTLSALYSGDLCVIKAPYSATELMAVRQQVEPHMIELGIGSVGVGDTDRNGQTTAGPGNVYRVSLTVEMYTPALARLIEKIGPNKVVVHPWLRRVS